MVLNSAISVQRPKYDYWSSEINRRRAFIINGLILSWHLNVILYLKNQIIEILIKINNFDLKSSILLVV